VRAKIRVKSKTKWNIRPVNPGIKNIEQGTLNDE
jgi:hypothetical protein